MKNNHRIISLFLVAILSIGFLSPAASANNVSDNKLSINHYSQQKVLQLKTDMQLMRSKSYDEIDKLELEELNKRLDEYVASCLEQYIEKELSKTHSTRSLIEKSEGYKAEQVKIVSELLGAKTYSAAKSQSDNSQYHNTYFETAEYFV